MVVYVLYMCVHTLINNLLCGVNLCALVATKQQSSLTYMYIIISAQLRGENELLITRKPCTCNLHVPLFVVQQ